MSFLTVLTIVFIVLKLMGIIAWSWFFVLLPSIVFVVIWVAAVTYYSPFEEALREYKKGVRRK